MGKKRNFEQLLQAALQSLSASGGSLFAIPRRSRQLECVATTGLVKNPDSDIWAHDHLAYDMDREVSPTVVVACDNRRPLRLNRLGDVAEQYDQGLPDCRSKFMETLLDDDCERGRRFLAASMMIDREPLGVLRVVRSAAEKPFTAADEDLIAQLAEIGALLVCQWRQGKRAESRPRAVRDVECCTETN